jgi:N-acetylglucosamine-6-phosphate deacetylase
VPIRRRSRSLIRQIRGTNPLGVPGVLSFDHRIVRFDSQKRRLNDRILPGFIDLQINGAFGVDVMSATADELLHVSHCLAHEGVTGWLPTVITSPLDKIEQCDAVIADAMAEQDKIDRAVCSGSAERAMAAILGMHLEGPFISSKRLGAHPPLNILPRGEALERVRRLKTLKLITLAPELDGALDAIRVLTTHGVAVSVGHTDATYDQAMAGVKAGVRMFTHVFNAMPPMHHRSPGAAGAALSPSYAKAALIPDGIHVHPAVLRMAWRSRDPADTVLTTDRIALAGTEAPAQTLLGNTANAASMHGGVARLADGTLAGSVITMLDGIRMMNECVGSGFFGAFRGASHNPASILRLKDRGSLMRRARADLLLLDRDLNLKAVFIGGRELD